MIGIDLVIAGLVACGIAAACGGRTSQQRQLDRRVSQAKQDIETISRETRAAIQAEARRQARRRP
jgi:hypothetical protein